MGPAQRAAETLSQARDAATRILVQLEKVLMYHCLAAGMCASLLARQRHAVEKFRSCLDHAIAQISVTVGN